MTLFRIIPLCIYAALATWFSHAAFLVRKSGAESNNASHSNATALPDRIASQKAFVSNLSSRGQALNNTLNLHATRTQANQSEQQDGVVHFLFLATSFIPHVDIWRQFLSTAPPGSYDVYVHCKDEWDCTNHGLFRDNPDFKKVPTVETFYCHDLVTAMKVLLDNALYYSQAGGRREKFVFLSETTLPVKPFWEVSRQLLADDNSDFCVFPTEQWASGDIEGMHRRLVKHHQWVVLNREHAQLFVDSWHPVDEKRNWPVLVHGSATLEHSPKEFKYPPRYSSKCTDEYAFFAVIYGALIEQPHHSPHKFGGEGLDMNSAVTQGVCRTWSYWDHTWDPAATALASQIHNDFGSFMSCYPTCNNRPAELEQLSDSAFWHLRHSPFLFARKFSTILYMPTYYDHVLAY